MNCAQTKELLTSSLLNELNPVQEAELRAHLQTCGKCRAEADELRAALRIMTDSLTANAGMPKALPEKSVKRIMRAFWRHRIKVAAAKFSNPVMSRLLGYGIAACFLAVVLSGLLLPNLASVREGARRVNDLSHLNGLWKEAAAWGLNPADSFRPNFPVSLDTLVKEGKIRPEDLVSPVSGEPIEYFSSSDSDGDQPVLVSSSKGGRNVVKIAGQGLWVQDGTPEADKLDRQLAELRDSDAGCSASSESESFSWCVSARDQRASLSVATMPASIPSGESGITVNERVYYDNEQPFDRAYAQTAMDAEKSVRKDLAGADAGAAGTLRQHEPAPSAVAPVKPIQSRRAAPRQEEYKAAEVKEEEVVATTPTAQSTVARLTVDAPSSFVRTPTPMVTPQISPSDIKVHTDLSKQIDVARIARLMAVRDFQEGWKVQDHRSAHQVNAEFTLFQAQYQDGNRKCNQGALSNLLRQIREWSSDRIKAAITLEPLDIGSEELFTLKPPFVFFSGDRDFTLDNREVRNLRDYLMMGGAIWVDNADTSPDSPFANAIRREFTRVIPDRNFEIIGEEHPLFDSFYSRLGLPPGWNNARAPLEVINISDELAVLYTPNNYGRLLTYRLDKSNRLDFSSSAAEQQTQAPDSTNEIPAASMVVDAYKFGINIVTHMLIRYQKYTQFLPKTLPKRTPEEPSDEAREQPPEPVRRAIGVNPFVTVAEQPFSTFSLGVDSASYTLARNHLLRGLPPPPESVRTEEFVNFFDYNYAPPASSTFAIHADCGESAFGRGLQLLKIGVKGRVLGREEKKKANLTLLIDTSGSMATPDRLGIARQALVRMVDRLDPADMVAIVQFDSRARLVLPHTPVADKQAIIRVIESIHTSGSTSLEEGMALAYSVAARGFNGAAANRVMLISDGMANLGSTSADMILEAVAEYRRHGITLSVFGFGFGSYNDSMLEALANKGDGVYAFIDSMEEAQRVMVDELAATVNIIARDVKIQVEFNPARVARYRQLGYETRKLKKEDFRDDSVDAGEIGSGQSATALYELEIKGDDAREPIGVVRIRCRNELTGLMEEIERPIMPSSTGKTFADMDPRFRLAACAAHFAEILRGSPYAAGSTFEDVARALRPVALDLNLDMRIRELLRLTQTGLTPRFEDRDGL